METERDYEARLANADCALKFLEKIKALAVEQKKAKENKAATSAAARTA